MKVPPPLYHDDPNKGTHAHSGSKALIAGKTESTEAWTALDKRYGDKELALVKVRQKLASLDTSRGEGYEKVETLLQGVNKARATLKAVGAEAELFNDISIVAQLVSKLLGSHQDRWHQDKTSPDFMNDQRKTGEKFLGWIERLGTATVSARLTRQALTLSKPEQSAPPVQKYGVCGKGGHKTESCAGGEGKGKLRGLNWDQRASLEQGISGNAFAASRMEAEDGDRGRSPGTQDQGRGKDRVMPCLQRETVVPKENAMGIPFVAEGLVTGVQELPSLETPTEGRGDPRASRVQGLPILGPPQVQV